MPWKMETLRDRVGYTPKEMVLMQVVDTLTALVQEPERELPYSAEMTDKEIARARKSAEKLRRSLAERWGLDITPIDVQQNV